MLIQIDMLRVEPKFEKGDYVINRSCGSMAIVKGVTKKNYYQFSAYYDGMFHRLKDVKNENHDLQVNYQTFWDICNDEERSKLDEIIKQDKLEKEKGTED